MLSRIIGCDYRRAIDWWMYLLTTYTHYSELQVLTALSLISTIHKSLALAKSSQFSLDVSSQQLLTAEVLQLHPPTPLSVAHRVPTEPVTPVICFSYANRFRGNAIASLGNGLRYSVIKILPPQQPALSIVYRAVAQTEMLPHNRLLATTVSLTQQFLLCASMPETWLFKIAVHTLSCATTSLMIRK
jgi:hypothetical protein